MSKKNNLNDNPFQVYDNFLLLSSEKGTELPLKSDFCIGGDTAELMTAIVIQMNRHPAFAEMMKTAVKVYENSKVVTPKKKSVLDSGLPSRFRNQ